MKKHLTIFTLALLFAALLFSAAACGSDNGRQADRGGGQEATLPAPNEGATAAPEAETAPVIPDIPETPASEFEYRYNADTGGIEITEYRGSAIKVRVPEMIEEVPVKRIADKSFMGSGVMEVYLPGSVTDIGNWAFESCSSLTSIVIPNNVANIGNRAFALCTALTSIAIPDDVATIGAGVFSGCPQLTNIEYNGDIKPGIVVMLDGCQWRVLDVQNGNALVLREEVLLESDGSDDNGAMPYYRTYSDDSLPQVLGGRVDGSGRVFLSQGVLEELEQYHQDEIAGYEVKTSVTWEESTIRQYLNSDYYDSLSADLQSRIVETQVVNNDNPEYGALGGNDTSDKIFLLSIEEADKYFAEDSHRIAWRVYDSGKGNALGGKVWWLRSPVEITDPDYGPYGAGVPAVACVDPPNGTIGFSTADDWGNIYVRPAFWIRL